MSTVSHDSPMQLTVMGPRWTDTKALWACNVRVLHHHIELSSGEAVPRATRTVFVPRANASFFPTTIVARCHITQVTVRYGDDAYEGNGSFETTLLLGADNSDWFTDGFGNAHLRRGYCLAGEFPLKPFIPIATLPRSLRDMLSEIVDDVANVQNLHATAGGLSFSAPTIMPAGSAPVANAPYLVEVELPFPGPSETHELPTNTRGTVLVRLDRERLPRFPDGERSLKAYFTNLVSRLNPADPISKQPLLRWSRLDLADPTRIPEFQWRSTRNLLKEFEFAQGMWRLTLSDQASGVTGVIPRSSLVTSPQIKIKAAGNLFEVQGKPEGGGDSLWDALSTVRPEAEYKATFAQQTGWSENVSLRRVELGYDAIEVARQLRPQYGLKAPRTDDFEASTSSDLLAGTAPAADFSDGNIDPPVLWGFTPLHDGWVQLPFLNLTEQLFVDGLPDPALPAPAERRSALFRGAVLFGNDGEAPLRGPGHIPWNMVLTDARNYAGTWLLSSTGLQSVVLRLDDPVISTEGLFWLATDPPTSFDALPDQDNWLASLFQVPLKTPRRRPLRDQGVDDNGRPLFESTDPYPSPFSWQNVQVSIDRLISGELAEASLATLNYHYQWSPLLHRGTDRDYRILNLPKPAEPETAPPFTLSTEIPVWLTALPRSRFQQAEIWNITKEHTTDDRVTINATAVDRAQSPGLAWRRHPNHPFVQALPLTQNATPPNHFSPSRQFAPFELALTSREIRLKTDGTQSVTLVGPGIWSFKSVATSIASADWPTVENVTPAKAWRLLPSLPMVSLGIPGLVLLADAGGVEDPSTFLEGLQYRIDLPYLDEPNSLAELPSSPTPSQPPRPALLRSDYCEHWRKLNDKGLLASADAVESIIRDHANTFIVNVVEPLRWNVDVSANLDTYPGEIIFKDKTSNMELKLSGKADKHLFSIGAATPERLLDLNSLRIDRWLTDAFMNAGIELGSAAKIQVVTQNAEWHLTQAQNRPLYAVKNDAGTLVVYAVDTDALRGFDGGFTVTSDELQLKDVQTVPTQWTEQPVRIVGGSFTATVESSGTLLRDQRGLLRGESELLTGGADAPLRTPLQLNSRDPQTGIVQTDAFDLFTLRKPVTLAVGDIEWRLWFKGLPMQMASGGFKFERSLSVARANGVNDVGAMDREHGHLNGYEWVLANGTKPPKPFLDLGRFHFYPLELESAELDGNGAVQSLRVLGRLQLVLLDTAAEPPTAWIARELSQLDAAVFLDFQNGRLHEIYVAPPDADQVSPGKAMPHCWSLADPTLKPETPAIHWNQINYDRTLGAEQIIIGDWRIEYTRHGLPWTILPKFEAGTSGNRKSLAIPLADANKIEFDEFDLSTVQGPAGRPESDSAKITRVKLTLFDGHRHDLDVDWQFQCGEQDKLQIRVNLTDRLLRQNDDETGKRVAQLIHLGRALDLNVNWNLTAREVIDRRALQIVWTGTKRDKVNELQLLPGFRLADSSNALSGFAIFSLELVGVVRTAGTPAAVEPKLLGANAEMLFQCRWGESLSLATWEWGKKLDSEPRKAASQALFESSAGDLTAEYTIRFIGAGTTEPWTSKLILTGLVEIKNLISWPNNLTIDDKLKITVPGARQAGAELGHWRHAMRLVLSEHEFPDKILQGGSADCFLTIKSGAVWTIAAVCEHTLLSVDIVGRTVADPAGSLPGLEVDKPLCSRRWTCVQQVRVCSPRAVHDHLAVMGGRDTYNSLHNSHVWPNGAFNDLLHGWYAGAFCRALRVRNTQNPSQADFKASELGDSLDEAMIFEASAAVFIRRSAVNMPPGTDLVQMTHGVVRGGLADLADYQADSELPDSDDKQFLFAQVPFLGRSLVKQSWDGGPLKSDPVLTVASGEVAQRELALLLAQWGDNDAVALATAPLDIADQRWFRRLNSSSLREAWHRLNVTRSIHAQTATGEVKALGLESTANGNSVELPPILGTEDSDAATLVARGSALGPLFDARRMSLPPSELPSPPRKVAFETLVWSRNSLQVLRAAVDWFSGGTQSFPFIGFPIIFHKSQLLDGKETDRRHPAATLLPIPRDFIQVPLFNSDGTRVLERDGKQVFSKGRQTLEPVSLVLSPVVSIEPVDLSGDSVVKKPLLAVGELVGFDPLGRRAVIIDSQISYAAEGRTEFEKGFKEWGAVVHAQMAADSGVAVSRIRKLLTVTDKAGALLGLEHSFSFIAVDVSPDERDLVVRALPLRAAPAQIRTHEGQFRGTQLPAPIVSGELPDYALAPPLVAGVQPVRLNGRANGPPDGVPDWPWGFAGLRVSTAYRRQGDSPLGVVGPQFDGMSDGVLWWQSLAQPVQFSNPADRQILPKLFRGPALPGYLPTWPHTPLPESYALDEWIRDRPSGLNRNVFSWQSILPGGRVVLVTGLRPGVSFAFRELLTTQVLKKPATTDDFYESNADQVVQSTSVPVQHRPPRPILIPPSLEARQTIALRTWGHWFDLDEKDLVDRTVIFESHPYDDAFFMLPEPQFGPAGGLRLMLAPPTEEQVEKELGTAPSAPLMQEIKELFAGPTGIPGEVDKQWDGTVRGNRQLLGTVQRTFGLTGILTVGEVSVPLVEDNNPPDSTKFPLINAAWSQLQNCLIRFQPSSDDTVKIRKQLVAAPQGMPIRVAVKVALEPNVYTLEDYCQTLTMILRFRRLDVAHEVSRGEDRRIFSPRYLKFEDAEYNRRLSSVPAKASRNIALTPPARGTITLAADRTEYNPGDTIQFVYTRDPQSSDTAGTTGTVSIYRKRDQGLIELAQVGVAMTKLYSFDLADVGKGEIRGEENLILRLTLNGVAPEDKDLDLVLAIVARPVTPVPEAAYALLRTTDNGNSVECVRFAWAPDPERVELVCPDDLLAAVVRRRAVFHLADTIRNTEDVDPKYQIQKITSLGSTHFPVERTD
jgi:hypothetical protein